MARSSTYATADHSWSSAAYCQPLSNHQYLPVADLNVALAEPIYDSSSWIELQQTPQQLRFFSVPHQQQQQEMAAHFHDSSFHNSSSFVFPFCSPPTHQVASVESAKSLPPNCSGIVLRRVSSATLLHSTELAPKAVKAQSMANKQQMISKSAKSKSNSSAAIRSKKQHRQAASISEEPRRTKTLRRIRVAAKRKRAVKTRRHCETERFRTQLLNDAFETLKCRIPLVPKSQKVPKIKTLNLAVRYIQYLTGILDGDLSVCEKPFENVVYQELSRRNAYTDRIGELDVPINWPLRSTPKDLDVSNNGFATSSVSKPPMESPLLFQRNVLPGDFQHSESDFQHSTVPQAAVSTYSNGFWLDNEIICANYCC